MTTARSPVTRATPLPCLKTKRQHAPLKPTLSRIQPILPDIAASPIALKSPTKKRVRFALKLDPLDESENELPIERLSLPSTPAPHKLRSEPWRENGSLFGAYTEYLQEKNALTPDLIETARPTTPSPDFESSSTFTQTFHIQTKSPSLVVDSITIRTPSASQLPRIVERTKTVKKIVKKPSSPTFDIPSRQRLMTPTPTRTTQVKKTACPANYKNTLNSSQTNFRRNESLLPRLKSSNTTERVIRADHSIGSKLVNEYIQAKKVTEIITNPLPGSNNQISYICGHSIVPHLRKTSPTYQNQIASESYFYQTHHNDHLPQIIHSTH